MSHLCKTASGHLKKRASGHLANGCPADCSTCPDTFTLIVSGLSACSCISGPGFGSPPFYHASGAPNGTFTLTRTSPGGSTWESGATGVSVSEYSDSGCTTLVTSSGTFWRLTCSGTGASKTWALTLVLSSSLSVAVATFSGSTTGDCSGGTISNGTPLFCGTAGQIFAGSHSASFA